MPAVHLPKKPWVSDTITARGNETIQQKKQILIVDGNDKERKRSVKTDAGTVKFVEGTAVLPNDARGRDIASEYYESKCLDRGGVAVVRDREGMWRDPIHKDTFAFHGVPWATYDELGRRINGEDSGRATPQDETELLEGTEEPE
jgi:hypothetical protein